MRQKRKLIRELANSAHVSPAAAADAVDRMVHDILMRLRKGTPADVPGVAVLVPQDGGPPKVLPFGEETGGGDENS